MKTDNTKESGKDTQSSQKKNTASNAPGASPNKTNGKKDTLSDSSNKGKGPKGENL